MKCKNKWLEYEREKKKITDKNLSFYEYEKEIVKLIERLEL